MAKKTTTQPSATEIPKKDRALIAAALKRAAAGNAVKCDADLEAGSHDFDMTLRIVGTVEMGEDTRVVESTLGVDDLIAAHLIEQGITDEGKVREYVLRLAREIKSMRGKKTVAPKLNRAIADVKAAIKVVAKELKLQGSKPRAGSLKGDPDVRVVEFNAEPHAK